MSKTFDEFWTDYIQSTEYRVEPIDAAEAAWQAGYEAGKGEAAPKPVDYPLGVADIERIYNLVHRAQAAPPEIQEIISENMSSLYDGKAAPSQEPVHQWRKKGTWQWADGHPDHDDGKGPYEIRTLYITPPDAAAQIAELERCIEDWEQRNAKHFRLWQESKEQIATLEQERDSFHMDYRMKCDSETKALREQIAKLEAQLSDAKMALEYVKQSVFEDSAAFDIAKTALRKLK